MKPTALLLGTAFLFSAGAFAGPLPPKSVSARPARNTAPLTIVVYPPRNLNSAWVSDDVSARFSDLLVRALRAQGVTSPINTLKPETSGMHEANLLSVRLIDWVADKGLSDCSFKASLRNRAGEHDLGLFYGDNVIVTADGQHKFSSEGLVGSALEAANDLRPRLEEAGFPAAK
jgi:hypothetical protein